MPRNHAGAVEAEQYRFCGLGKNLAAQIGTDQEDRDFLRDAAASAHNLLWQQEGHTETAAGPISYLSLLCTC